MICARQSLFLTCLQWQRAAKAFGHLTLVCAVSLPAGGASCLELMLVGGGGGGGGVGLDVFEVAGVAQEMPVQRVAAVALLVVQLHLAVLKHSREKRLKSVSRTPPPQ